MPNLCESNLTVTGPKGDIEAFINFAKKDQTPFSADKFVPMPEEIRSTQPPGQELEMPERVLQEAQANDWYNWSIRNWGTKWDAQEVTMEVTMEVTISPEVTVEATMSHTERDTVSYDFWTPWDPFSNELIAVISAKFPTLNIHFEYTEPMAGFHGHCTAEGGVVLESEITEEEEKEEDE